MGGETNVLNVQQEKTFNGYRGFRSTGAAHQQPVSPPEMIEVFVNDQPLQIPKGSTVMAACDAAGIDIPRSFPAAHEFQNEPRLQDCLIFNEALEY